MYIRTTSIYIQIYRGTHVAVCVCLLSSTGLYAARKLYIVSALLDKALNYQRYWLCLNLKIMGNGNSKLPLKQIVESERRKVD